MIQNNKVIEINNAPVYIGVNGAILFKDDSGFLVKTSDAFVKVVDYEYVGNFKVGDRFEIR